MRDNHKFDALELSMLPRDERTCVVDNELIISDNFDEDGNVCDLSSDPRMRGFILAPYPFKMQFAMVQMCVAGSMRLSHNLTEYELHRNSMMIVTPGSIGQCLELSPDCRLAIIALANGGSITEKNRDGRSWFVNSCRRVLYCSCRMVRWGSCCRSTTP